MKYPVQKANQSADAGTFHTATMVQDIKLMTKATVIAPAWPRIRPEEKLTKSTKKTARSGAIALRTLRREVECIPI